jgi:hypothetical protein
LPVVIDRPQSSVSATITELAAMLAGIEFKSSDNGYGQGNGGAASGLLTRLFNR